MLCCCFVVVLCTVVASMGKYVCWAVVGVDVALVAIVGVVGIHWATRHKTAINRKLLRLLFYDET